MESWRCYPKQTVTPHFPSTEYVLGDGAGNSGGGGSSSSGVGSGGNASGSSTVADSSTDLTQQLRGDGPPVAFALHKNLTVLVKLVKCEYPEGERDRCIVICKF